MCGIIGYVGARPATPVLLDSLQRLEYRGYDSAGIAVLDGANGGRHTVVKSNRESRVKRTACPKPKRVPDILRHFARNLHRNR